MVRPEADGGPRATAELLGTDRYEVRRRLGQGASGVVFEAWDRERGAAVALKWLRHVNADTIHRFKREFRSLAEISHPNLVQLYELANEGDRWFFTMELLDGRSLPLHLRPTSLPPGLETLRAARAAAGDAPPGVARPPASPAPLDVDLRELRRVFAQLARGVHGLHEAGKLHRDLKCQNVMVAADGRVVLLDFGLVWELDPRRGADEAEVAGTPVFMAPEQCAGRPVDRAADWYAVGVMLFRALTDRLPFEGPAPEVMRAKQRHAPPRPSALARGVPEDLDRLCVELLARRPADRPDGAAVLARLGVSAEPPVGRPPAPADVLVGRARELRALERARRAAPSCVYVHGASGMGKTALVRWFLDGVRASCPDALVLEGRCFERETLPYKALDSVVDSLATALRRMPPSAVARMVPPDAPELVRVFPTLGRVPALRRAAEASAKPLGPQEQRRRASAAFGELLRRLAREREVLVFIDDLQWGDRDSAAFVAPLQRAPDAPRVTWIGTFRTDEAAASPYLEALDVPGGGERPHALVELGELDDEDARTLLGLRLEGRAHRARLIEALAAEAAGSPLFIDLLVRRTREGREAPRAGVDLRTIIGERVEGLSEASRRLLGVLAVRGRPLDAALAAEAVGARALDVTELTHLRNGHLIRMRERDERSELELYHDRIRETVLAQLAPSDERALHARLADTLGALADPDPESLAFHCRGAGRIPEAFAHTVEAAHRAERALAFERAAELYAAAVELSDRLPQPPRPDGPTGLAALRIARADALRNAGHGAEAARTYLAAAGQVPKRRAFELRRLAGEQYLQSGHVDEGRAVLGSVLAEVGMTLPKSPGRALVALLARRAQVRLRGLRFTERPPQEIAPALSRRLEACWAVAVGLAMIDPVRGGIFQARHLLLALEAGDLARVARAVAIEIPFAATAGVGNRPRTAALERLGRELADRSGDEYTDALLSETTGGAAWLEGRWADALAHEERGVAILRGRSTGAAWEITTGTIVLFDSLWRMGRWRELLDRHPAILADAESRGDLLLEIYLRIKFRALSRLAADRPDEALREARAALERWSQSAFTLLHLWELFVACEAHLYAGRPWTAREHLRAGWPALRRSQLLRLEMYDMTMRDLWARVHLACAGEASGRHRARLLQKAEAVARRLERRGPPWAAGPAAALRAGVAVTRGDAPSARRALDRAEAGFAAAHMGLHARVVGARRAQLDGGTAALEEARAWLRGQGLADPAPWIALLTPGRYPDQG